MTGVVHVVTALERGGAQRVVLELAAGLHDPGRPQLVITGPRVDGAGLDDEAEARLGARLIRLRDLAGPVHPLKDAACLVELTRVLDGLVDKLRSPVVVHTHSSKAGVLGRLAARALRGVVSVHTVHGFGFDALGGEKRWLLESAERLSDACDVVVFVSDADRDRAAAMGLYRRSEARVIRAGIDPAPFAKLPHVQHRGGAVTVANLKAQKDPLFHVEVLAAWRARDPAARLVILGDGPLRDEVEARARALGVSDALELPGFVDDTRAWLAGADVLLLASAWEGLPCAVLEATAAGLPCVVRDTGYARDLAWAKRVRALPRDAHPAAFADALMRAVAEAKSIAPATRTRQAKLPRAFTQKGMLADVSELYDELIGPPRPTGAAARRRPMPRGRR